MASFCIWLLFHLLLQFGHDVPPLPLVNPLAVVVQVAAPVVCFLALRHRTRVRLLPGVRQQVDREAVLLHVCPAAAVDGDSLAQLGILSHSFKTKDRLCCHILQVIFRLDNTKWSHSASCSFSLSFSNSATMSLLCLLWTLLQWSFRLLHLLYAFPHSGTGHTCGFSPVCDIMWILRRSFCAYVLPQPSTLQVSRSGLLVQMRSQSRAGPRVRNVLPQCWL